MTLAGTDCDTARPDGAAAVLRSTTAVRERARQLLDRARGGGSAWFAVEDAALAPAAARVAAVTRTRYPDLAIPFHSRWRHFEAGAVDRKPLLADLLAGRDDAERARAMIDLTVVSVLLDAGAGADWAFVEPGTGLRLTRSEGLGVASWHAFGAGLFSGDPADPLRVDPGGLRRLDTPALAAAFQVRPDNPLVGLDGRVQLLRRLGEVLAGRPQHFGASGRPGGLFDVLTGAGAVSAGAILSRVLAGLAPIWPADNTIGDQSLGDCWRHDAVTGPGLSAGWMPFHKLSQWLTYSLLEPFQWAGVPVTGLEELTGLPEYRNGGLLLDTGVLQLRDPALAQQNWAVGDELVVEWRALTVALLDELAPLVRSELGPGAAELPLACILEGGTWAAGRVLAQQLRGGPPPLSIVSDGTVF